MEPIAVLLAGSFAIVGGVAAMLRSPKIVALVAVTLAVFSESLASITRISQLGLLDEISVPILILAVVAHHLHERTRIYRVPGVMGFALFALLGSVSGLIAGVDPQLLAQGALLAGKGLVTYWCVAQFRLTRSDLAALSRFLTACGAVVVITSLANLAAPILWNGLFNRVPNFRGSIPTLIGPFTHPLAFGNVAAAGAVVAFAYVLYRRHSRWAIFIWLGLLMATVLTLRRTAIAALIVTSAFLLVRRFRTGGLIAVALAIPIAVLLALDELIALISWTWNAYDPSRVDAARTIMTLDSLTVATEHAPLGAGFARFGSYLAGEFYSPLYVELGYHGVWGLSPLTGNDTFLYDTQWPAILGEAGWIGAFGFVAGCIAILRCALRLTRSADSSLAWWGWASVSSSFVLLVASVAAPVFYSPAFYGIYFGFAGVAVCASRITNLVRESPGPGSNSHAAAGERRDTRYARRPGQSSRTDPGSRKRRPESAGR